MKQIMLYINYYIMCYSWTHFDDADWSGWTQRYVIFLQGYPEWDGIQSWWNKSTWHQHMVNSLLKVTQLISNIGNESSKFENKACDVCFQAK